MNSRSKGKRGELEVVHLLKELGIEARRGQQYEGSSNSPDVVVGPPLETLHIEVKRREAGNLYHWLAQAKNECAGKTPVVFHKRNGEEWVAILSLIDFLTIMRLLHGRQTQ